MCEVMKHYEDIARADARAKTLFALVQKEKLPITDAAEEMGISIPEFGKLMTDAGFKIPSAV